MIIKCKRAHDENHPLANRTTNKSSKRNQMRYDYTKDEFVVYAIERAKHVTWNLKIVSVWVNKVELPHITRRHGSRVVHSLCFALSHTPFSCSILCSVHVLAVIIIIIAGDLVSLVAVWQHNYWTRSTYFRCRMFCNTVICTFIFSSVLCHR